MRVVFISAILSAALSFVLLGFIVFTGVSERGEASPVRVTSVPVRFVGFRPLDLSSKTELKKVEKTERKVKTFKVKSIFFSSRKILKPSFSKDFVSAVDPPKCGVSLPFVGSLPASAFEGISVSGGKGSLGFLDSPPVLVTYVKPIYPWRARELGIEGTVVVRIFVDERGIVRRVKIVKSSPPGVFERSVLEAVKSWKFIPARDGGRPVSCWIEKPIRFKLGG